MKFYLLLTLIMTSVIQTWASDSISYSGRLVNANGSPVTGYVNLTFELAHTDQLGVILCSKEIDGVGLSNGVFHVKLSFSNCNLTNLLSSTGPSQTISIRVIDRTQEPDKIYSFQTINSVPVSVVSQVSKQVDQMGAVTGQVLTWNGTKWAPASEVGTGNGTVTSVGTGSGLEGGTITSAGTISIATSGVEGFHIKDGTITDTDISWTAEIQQSKIQNLVADLAAKQNSVAAGTIAQYWRGDKSWQDMDQSVRNALLLGYSTGSATPLSPTDNVIDALGKLEGQIIANDTAFNNAGQWEKSGSIIYYNTGNVGVGNSTPSEKLDVAGNIALSGKIRLKDSGSNYVELKSPTTIAGTVTFILPGFLGSNGQVLATDALGNLTWSTPATTSSNIVDGSIVDADISSSANIAQSKIANLTTDLSSKEPTLIAGTTVQYLRGDKSWQTLNTDAVVEGTKLYFTESKVLGTDLTGLSAIPGNITDSDNVLSAIGKLAGNQSNYVLRAGDLMTGNLLMGGNYVTGLGTPLLDSDAATKLYVDTELSNKTYWTKTVNDLSYISGNVGVGTTTPLNKLDVVGDIGLSGKIRLKSDTANYIELKAPTGLGSTQTYTLPSTTGTSGYALTTNGAGTLTWSAVATNSTSIGGDLVGTISNAQIVAGTIVNADIADTTINYGKLNLIDGDIPQAKVNGLATTLGGKEPSITAGTTSQYWRGDKTWQSLSTTVVSEGTNLYFLDSRVRDALMSGYVTGTATPLSAADTLLEALAKLEGQILANKAAFDSTGQWNKNGSSVYYNGGHVGIGITNPTSMLDIVSDGTAGVSIKRISDINPPFLAITRARGVTGTEAKVQSGDLLGQIRFRGLTRNNTDTADSEMILSYIASTVESLDASLRASSKLGFLTSTNSASATEKMTILSNGNVGVGILAPADKLDVAGNIAATGKLRLKSDTVNHVELRAPASLASTLLFSLPGTYGTSGQALTTNGAGVLSWNDVATTASAVGGDLSGTIANAQIVSGSVGSTEIADLSIVNGDIANTTITYGKLSLVDGDIPQAKVNGLVSDLAGKEPSITAGTTAQYFRGDKIWATLNTTAVPEGTGLYFTEPRVRASTLTGYGVGTAIPLAASDTLIQGLGKLEAQIIANDAAFDSTGQWSKNSTTVYYNTGSVGVGTSTPVASALMDLTSTTQGFLPPRMTTAQRNTIPTPASGIFIYNTSTGQHEYFNGTQWNSMGGVPNGTIAAFASTVCPTGWSEYTLARGRFLRGIDNGAGNDPDGTRAPGSLQADAVEDHKHNIEGQSGGINNVVAFQDTNPDSTYSSGGSPGTRGDSYFYVGTMKTGRAAVETRAKNVAVLYCVYQGGTSGAAPPELSVVGGVSLSSVSDGQALVFNSISGKWENENIASALGFTPVNKAGDTMSGNLTLPASSIGVGTSSPSMPLHVTSVNSATGLFESSNLSHTNLQISNLASGKIWSLLAVGTSVGGFGSTGTFTIDESSGGARLSIAPGGNVGIGTATPAAKLDVRGSFMAVNSYGGYTDAAIDFPGDYGQLTVRNSNVTTDLAYLDFHRGGSTSWQQGMLGSTFVIASGGGAGRTTLHASRPLAITTTGNVGIGVTAPGYRLQVGSAGDGSEARANAWNALSDERLKKDFTLIEAPLEKLLGIDGYTYFWKQGLDTKKKIGLKAQEVKKVFPEAVSKGSDGYYSLSYDHLVAPIIGAIKELYNKWLAHETEIKELKEKNEKLMLRNLALEERMDRLEKTMHNSQQRRPASMKLEENEGN